LERKGWYCTVGLVKGARFHRPDAYLKVYPFGRHIQIEGSMGYVEQRHESLYQTFDAVRPDVVVCFNLADALYAAVNWKIRGNHQVRIVYAVHSLALSILNDVQRCAPYIDLIASVSARGCDLLREQCGEQCPAIAHLPTGVPAPQRQTVWQAEPFTVGYVGRLDPKEKRILDLVDLIRASDDGFRFVIAGKGSAEAALKHALTPWVAEGRVVFHGQVDRKTLYRDIYPRLQSLVLFSPMEGGPIVAWEAMRHGTVLVVSDFQGRKEEGVICHNRNALVFPVGDSARAAQLLAALRVDRARWQALSDAAIVIPADYHLESFGARWEAALAETLKRPVRLGDSKPFLFESTGLLSSIIRSPRLRLWLWQITGRHFRHGEAGGEWPHSYTGKVRQMP
jgi:glycosyltransferase involved in cell wall biosynthesis